MKKCSLFVVGASALLLSTVVSFGEIKVVVAHNPEGTPEFKFGNVPSPSKVDAASKAKFIIVDGEQDPAGGDVTKLTDGKLPDEQDQPAENFFFAENTDGGRLQVDLGGAIDIQQVNTYSWHPNTRGPQVYKLYASDGTAGGFNAKPKKGTDPLTCGWKSVAKVDTRSKGDSVGGGQYAVSTSDSEATIGKYRYLLFDCSETEADDDSGNTFFSEIDVVAKDGAAPAAAPAAAASDEPYVVHTSDGKCEFTINTSGAPDLKDWARTNLAPVLADWYPKISAMLASDGFTAPSSFSVTISPGRGVAATGGTHITANATWLKGEIGRQAVGSIVHEAVHVVQQYGEGRRTNPNATPTPGWLTEGIADYLRWFLYEPQSHGADDAYVQRQRNFPNVRYDASYRVTANFLNYVVGKYDKNLVTQLNATIRQAKYTDDLWKQLTGKTVQELGAEWKDGLTKNVAAPTATGGSSTNSSH